MDRGSAPAATDVVETRRRIAIRAAGAASVATGLSTYVFLADPHRRMVFPPCPFKALTGLDCPLCGGTRMAFDLMHGDLAGAAQNNLFVLAALPLLLAVAGAVAIRRWQGRQAAFPMQLVIALGGAAVVWLVVRNLPGWPLVPT
jgi:hypothetical protein